MTKLYRFRGGPGSGKTTRLIQFITDELKGGTLFDDISVMTFSRSQATDLASSLRTELPDLPVKLISERCATIDATIYRQCKASGLFTTGKNPILQPGDSKSNKLYETFMDQHQLEFDAKALILDTDDSRRIVDTPAGNQFITLNSYLASTMQPHDSWQDSASNLGLTLSPDAYDLPKLLRAWNEYKSNLQIVEHADYCQLALDQEITPPSPILIIDEYQDVSPLQHALLKHWIEHPDTKRVFVAGDEDQSIYGFRGCDPALFISLPAQDIGSDGNASRPTSHRCPVEIMEIAEKILGKPSNVFPHTQWHGRANHRRCHTADDLVSLVEAGVKYMHKNNFPKMFILSRFINHAQKIARTLVKHGIPCQGIKEKRNQVWGSASINGHKIDLYELKSSIQKYLSTNAEVRYDEALTLLHALGDQNKSLSHDLISEFIALDKSSTINSSHLHQMTGGLRDDILDRLNLTQSQVDQIRACLHRETSRGFSISPDMIQIDTIHAAKGLEAPVTLLHSGYLKNRYSELIIPEQIAEERRIYFTGATRALHHLVILDYGKSPVCPLLEAVI